MLPKAIFSGKKTSSETNFVLGNVCPRFWLIRHFRRAILELLPRTLVFIHLCFPRGFLYWINKYFDRKLGTDVAYIDAVKGYIGFVNCRTPSSSRVHHLVSFHQPLCYPVLRGGGTRMRRKACSQTVFVIVSQVRYAIANFIAVGLRMD